MFTRLKSYWYLVARANVSCIANLSSLIARGAATANHRGIRDAVFSTRRSLRLAFCCIVLAVGIGSAKGTGNKRDFTVREMRLCGLRPKQRIYLHFCNIYSSRQHIVRIKFIECQSFE